MSRQIKFRVWNISEKKFDYPSGYAITGDGHFLAYGKLFYSVDNPNDFVIQQFTGLLDKNEREIYEGDIVKCTWSEGLLAWEGKGYPKEGICRIRWESNGWIIPSHPGAFEPPQDSCGCANWQNEIIGNIFESPKLLTK